MTAKLTAAAPGSGDEYVPKLNGKITDKVAKIVGSAFDSMKAQGVRRCAKHLVDLARPKSHALHTMFEWDDRVAGEKHRLAQAGELIRNVQIYISEEQNQVKAFHSVAVHIVDGEPVREYETHMEVVKNLHGEFSQVSVRAYQSIAAECSTMKALGAHKRSKKWAAIISVVEKNAL